MLDTNEALRLVPYRPGRFELLLSSAAQCPNISFDPLDKKTAIIQNDRRVKFFLQSLLVDVVQCTAVRRLESQAWWRSLDGQGGGR